MGPNLQGPTGGREGLSLGSRCLLWEPSGDLEGSEVSKGKLRSDVLRRLETPPASVRSAHGVATRGDPSAGEGGGQAARTRTTRWRSRPEMAATRKSEPSTGPGPGS